jgi:hypothetical protein
VPVDQLLPQDPDEGFGRARDDEVIDLTVEATNGAESAAARASRRDADDRVSIDLNRLQTIGGQERDMLTRYLGMIQVQRQDFNGKVLTIRNEDLRAIACLFETNTDSMRRRLDELGLRR